MEMQGFRRNRHLLNHQGNPVKPSGFKPGTYEVFEVCLFGRLQRARMYDLQLEANLCFSKHSSIQL
jgi:hypothetical protein